MAPATAPLIQQAAHIAAAHILAPVVCVTAAEPQTVARMRAFGREHGQRWGLHADLIDDLCLVISEYVSNALLHSGSPDVAVKIAVGRRSLSVVVRDTGQWRRPRPPRSCEEAEHGRGTYLVRHLSTVIAAGRHHPARGGTLAWAQLELAPGSVGVACDVRRLRDRPSHAPAEGAGC